MAAIMAALSLVLRSFLGIPFLALGDAPKVSRSLLLVYRARLGLKKSTESDAQDWASIRL